jgi:hypothetical protein
MTIELFDSIALTHPLTAMREDGGGPISLAGGTRGAVVMIYGDHEAYEVEFMDGEYTLALLTLFPQDVRLAEKHHPADVYAAID